MTMPSVCADETHCPSAFDTAELVAVAIFTVEYALRVYAAPEAYPVSLRSSAQQTARAQRKKKEERATWNARRGLFTREHFEVFIEVYTVCISPFVCVGVG